MTNEELCNMCVEHIAGVKCEHEKNCVLLNILRENRKLKAELNKTKKERNELHSSMMWDKFPDMMGKC